MFPRWKTIDGRKRRYLVESYRNEKGKPRQRHVAYIDLWPEKDVAGFIELHRKYAEAIKNANSGLHTKAYKQRAAVIAEKYFSRIKRFEGAMEVKMRSVRYYSDGRVGPDRYKRHREHPRLPPDPYHELLSFFNPKRLKRLEDILERLAVDAFPGPVRGWSAARKQLLRHDIEPVMKYLDELWAELQ